MSQRLIEPLARIYISATSADPPAVSIAPSILYAICLSPLGVQQPYRIQITDLSVVLTYAPAVENNPNTRYNWSSRPSS